MWEPTRFRSGVVAPPKVARMSLTIRAGVPSVACIEVRDIDGRAVVWVDLDSSERRGALSSTSSSQIEAAAVLARTKRMPLIAVIRSSGADIEEGFAALHGWGLAARAIADCSGVVPIVMIVDGPAVSGPALLIGLADLVVMTNDSYAFVSGPTMVAEFTGVLIDNDELGGPSSHARYTGAATLVAGDIESAIDVVANLLAYLPSNNDEEPPTWPTDDSIDRETPEAGALMPTTSTGSYDVRDVIRALVDDGDMLELRARWASNVVTAFATIGGMPVGVVANQPISLAGTLDIPASQKAARFVAFCDAFNLPIITLVDTPGFYPGKDLEWRGMIRHGAQLVFAYGRATVPRICVVLRKSYGGAYIVMDSKKMGNDLCLAWPWAELAVMGAGQAAAILQRRATPEERAAFEADYSARLLNPYIAAERGYIDAVIDPAETRSVIGHALQTLIDKRERLQPRPHDNTPL
jgi:acetyl-CoA carboxylase carboxyltransferase component